MTTVVKRGTKVVLRASAALAGRESVLRASAALDGRGNVR